MLRHNFPSVTVIRHVARWADIAAPVPGGRCVLDKSIALNQLVNQLVLSIKKIQDKNTADILFGFFKIHFDYRALNLKLDLKEIFFQLQPPLTFGLDQ